MISRAYTRHKLWSKLTEKRLIGYARVSTYGQTRDSQLEQLRAAGCSSRNMYREKVTGVRADRRELNRMLRKLAPGDVVTVTRIDRLARSTIDLFGIVKRIAEAKAQFRSLAEPWADTGTSTGRLMLAVLGGLADVERDLIRTRTAEGRSRAKALGSIWAGPDRRSLHRSSRKKHGGGGRKVPRSKNWPMLTTSAWRRFRDLVDEQDGEPCPTRTTQLCDRRREELSLDEAERNQSAIANEPF
jgi:DNA invertase Pin-like site-specific DNA recombinase